MPYTQTASMNTISPSPRTSLYGQLADDFRERILSGELKPGEKLPSFTEMRAQHRVSQATLNRVHGLLEAEGLILRKPGAGTFVSDYHAPVTFNGAKSHWDKVSFLSNAVVIVTPFGKPVAVHRSNGWLEWIAQGAADAVQSAGRHAVSLNPDISDAEVERLVLERPFGALIPANLSEASTPLALMRKLRGRRVPVVAFGNSPALNECDHILSDHESGAYQLTRLFLEQGKRRILMVESQALGEAWLSERYAGYVRAMQEANLEPQKPIQIPPISLLPSAKMLAHGQLQGFESQSEMREIRAQDLAVFESQVRSVAGYFVEAMSGSEPVEAILSMTDRDAFTLAAVCRLFGKQPNHDVLIAGYDNFYADCEEQHIAPFVPFATVDKNNRVIGASMMQLLLERVGAELDDAPQVRVIEPKLVIPDQL